MTTTKISYATLSTHSPDLHRHITAARGDDLAVGGPAGGPDGAGMVAIDDKLASSGGVPEMDRAIVTAGGEKPAIGTIGDRMDRLLMAG